MSAREDILARIRSALGPSPTPTGSPMPAATDPADADPQPSAAGGSPTPAPHEREEVVGLFVERVADYRAVVVRCMPGEVADKVREGLGESVKVVVPQGFPDEWLGLPEGAARLDDDHLTSQVLDGLDAVVTTATVGIAVTGTIILDHGPGQGRRALSLVPDRHVCVVRVDQVVPDVPDAVARLDPVRAMTWISGPSATSDIELDRVEGVHGPRTLHVVVVDG